MNNLNPFISHNLLDELFRDISPSYLIKPLHGDPLPSQIKLDIKENPAEFTVHVELPGTTKENIHVQIDNNVVSIRAEIAQIDTETKEDKVLRSERYYGQVARSFQLPVEIDQTASKAKYENGILTLNLIKSLSKSSQPLLVE